MMGDHTDYGRDSFYSAAFGTTQIEYTPKSGVYSIS